MFAPPFDDIFTIPDASGVSLLPGQFHDHEFPAALPLVVTDIVVDNRAPQPATFQLCEKTAPNAYLIVYSFTVPASGSLRLHYSIGLRLNAGGQWRGIALHNNPSSGGAISARVNGYVVRRLPPPLP